MLFFKEGTLSRQQTHILKALGIVFILLHNLCHNIKGAVVENEMWFYRPFSEEFLKSLTQFDHPLINFFSYFGHYGVAVFVFCTGYGLTLGGATQSNPIFYRMKKMWSVMISALLCYLTIGAALFAVSDMWDSFYFETKDLFVFTFLSNLVLPLKSMFLFGPWWYWGLAMQLVLLYYLLVNHRSMKTIVAIAVGSLLVGFSIIAFVHNDWSMQYFKSNFCGWILPFVAGIYMARRKVLPSLMTIILALLLIVPSFLNGYLWHFSQLFALVLFMGLGRLFEGKGLRRLSWIGEISMYLFATHTIVRWWLQPQVTFATFPYLVVVYLLSCFLLALCCRWLNTRWISPVIDKLSSRGR